MTNDHKPSAGPSEPGLVVYEQNTCTTCRDLATLLRERGVDYNAIEYHITGLTEPEILDVLRKLGARPRDVLRTREPLAEELGTADPLRHSDDELIALIAAHPQLVQAADRGSGGQGSCSRDRSRASSSCSTKSSPERGAGLISRSAAMCVARHLARRQPSPTHISHQLDGDQPFQVRFHRCHSQTRNLDDGPVSASAYARSQ